MASHDISWVRERMLAQSVPPTLQGGSLSWIRKNLFNGWLSSLLTLASVLVIASMVVAVGPWLANSVWQADSLGECRQILNGEPGACWGVIRDRWPQLVFGFYPPEQYARPVLAFVLLFVALAPLLFSRVPRKLLRFSFVYPGLVFWLIWGGTLWLPVMAYAGFMVGAALLRLGAKVSAVVGIVLAMAGSVTWWLFAADAVATWLAEHLVSLSLTTVASRELGGFLLSIIIGVTGIGLSLPLGILLALGRQSSMPLIKVMSVVFIEFVRGVPLITLLFTASLLLNYFLPPGTEFDLILRVIIMVTVFATAYIAEVIRGGLAALPRGQYEAAEALGLSYWKAQRLVIMPQALKISIPVIVSTFIGLFKDTTLVVFIGLLDPIALSTAIRASTDWQGIYWELFIFIGAVFFLFCFAMSRYSMYLERRLKTDHR